MTDACEAATALLDERPEFEGAFRDLLDVYENRDGSWELDDVAADSGVFGEIVAAGIVEKRDGGYRVVDPAGVKVAIEGDGDGERAAGRATLAGPSMQSIPAVDSRVAAALSRALLFLVALRLFSLPDVYRGGEVMLSGNDPYLYRYLVDRLVAETPGPFDPGALSSLPHRLAAGEPLLVVTLFVGDELLGGDTSAVDAGVVPGRRGRLPGPRLRVRGRGGVPARRRPQRRGAFACGPQLARSSGRCSSSGRSSRWRCRPSRGRPGARSGRTDRRGSRRRCTAGTSSHSRWFNFASRASCRCSSRPSPASCSSTSRPPSI
ncbi:hypothetical protein [Halegenticoccus tardaugens]|uniref:hypothetical protein n=1 Tax=Halegenticoccus tardaugens TaxID=2071624 RepID=UPI00100B9937